MSKLNLDKYSKIGNVNTLKKEQLGKDISAIVNDLQLWENCNPIHP
jgi:hypothetical protein